jgi:hypothetical protein
LVKTGTGQTLEMRVVVHLTMLFPIAECMAVCCFEHDTFTHIDLEVYLMLLEISERAKIVLLG